MRDTLAQNAIMTQATAISNAPRRGIWHRYVYAQTTAYSDFKGRASRADVLSFFFISYIFSFLLGFVCGFLGTLAGMEEDLIKGLVLLVTCGAFAIPTMSVSCRRLHDINFSGWWQLTFVFLLPFLIMLFCPSNKETNRFGPPCP